MLQAFESCHSRFYFYFFGSMSSYKKGEEPQKTFINNVFFACCEKVTPFE